MTRQEFLDGLRAALAVSNDDRLIESNISFYRQYFEDETARGRSEEEILQELGSPNLIATSILKAAGVRSATDGGPAFDARDTWDGDPTTFAQGKAFRGKEGPTKDDPLEEDPEQKGNPNYHKVHFQGWRGCLAILLIVLIIALVLRFLLFLIGGLFGMLLPF